MKVETTIEQLQAAVSTTARFASQKANLPVLGSVLITAEKGGRLILRATNIECGVEMIVPAKVISEGVVAVPAHTFSGFLSNAKGKGISLSLSGGTLKVETNSSSASIKTLPHDDFPLLPKVAATHSFIVKGVDLARAIRGVAYCASLSAVKPELQSVLLFAEGGRLYAVATDSFRLAEKSVPLKNGGTVPQLLIPARNAAELMRIAEGGQELEVYYNDNQLSCQIGSVYYTSRLLDGSFPNYRQIVPKTFSTEALLLREEMNQALKALSVFADKFAQISLSIEPTKKAIALSSRNPDVGEQISTLRATISGEATAVSFNGRYLADSLQGIVGDSVKLHSNGAGKPMLIKDSSDDSFFYLAMPMNR